MPTPRRIRLRALAAATAVLAAGGALAGGGMAATAADQPNLRPLLPTNHSNANSRWVDTQAVPGRTLYRFDSVILNTGGAFEVYRTGAGGQTLQRIWSGGAPPEDEVPPKSAPPAPGAGDADHLVAPAGGADSLRYSGAYGHWHFHSQRIAGYELLRPDGSPVAAAAKNLAGFCLVDTWGDESTTPTHYRNDHGQACAAEAPGTDTTSYTGPIRMGISRGWGDLYESQLWDQWVDVTAVTPGTYKLRATVDPGGIYLESDRADDQVIDGNVVIPGVIAEPRQVATPAGTPVAVPLAATVIGREVKSRRPGCAEDQTFGAGCMTTATSAPATLAIGPLPADKGKVALSGSTATYTPPAGFHGVVTFTYTGTDSRGLTSKPATVRVTVGSPGSGAGRSGGSGGSTGGSAGAGSTAKFTLSARQLLINQRIGQASIRRLAAVEARLDGRSAPTFPNSGTGGGRVTLSARQLLINQRIYQAAIRRAATLEARLDAARPPTFGKGAGGTVTLTVRQLRVNQRIAQAAVRRANALQGRVGL